MMPGYIWPFILSVALPKTQREDTSPHEDYFSIKVLQETCILAVPSLYVLNSHLLFLPPSSSCYPASRAYLSSVCNCNWSCRSLCDSARWLMASRSDDWSPTPVLITPASFPLESSGNGTHGLLCNNMQQDREQQKNSPLVGLPMSEIFISDRRQESRE